MYLTTDMLGDELTEILEKKEGAKDLYNIEYVLNVIVNHIDSLNYEIEDLKEEISDLKSRDDYDYSNDYFKVGE